MEQRESKRDMLRFEVGGRRYEIPVAEVERVLSLQRRALSPIPFGLGGRIEGLFSFRGVALPLIRVGDGPLGPDGDEGLMTVVLLAAGGRRFGVAVDSVSSVSNEAEAGAAVVCAQALYEGSAGGL